MWFRIYKVKSLERNSLFAMSITDWRRTDIPGTFSSKLSLNKDKQLKLYYNACPDWSIEKKQVSQVNCSSTPGVLYCGQCWQSLFYFCKLMAVDLLLIHIMLKQKTHIAAIKIRVERISHLLKLVSNQIIAAMPIKGVINRPGALNVFSFSSLFFILNLMVDKITARQTSKMAALANTANCLKPPEIEKIKINEPQVITAKYGVANLG